MNEIVLSSGWNDFEWLFKTDLTKENLGMFIGAIYDESYNRIEMYDKVPPFSDITPTKYMLFDMADTQYQLHYWEYIQNGHEPDELEFVNELMAKGERKEQIISDWDEMRYSANGYGVPYDSPERAYIRDIGRALDLFHMSYWEDDTGDNIISDSPSKNLRLANNPIVVVW